MANENNLIPHQFTSSQSREEAAKNGAKGGRASGVSRRRKKALRELARMVLDSKPNLPYNVVEAMQRMGMSARKQQPTIEEISLYAIAQKALKGDIKSLDYLLTAAGETPMGEYAYMRAEEERKRVYMDEEDSADDGFISALNSVAAEVDEDAIDEPEDVGPEETETK